MKISVIIPTYNPDPLVLKKALDAVFKQSLANSDYECIIVDNASSPVVESLLEPQYRGGIFKCVREERQGLSFARLTGVKLAETDLLVFCDDDNILAKDYLECAVSLMKKYSEVGAAGGKSIPEYEIAPSEWYEDGMAPLGCRDLGDISLQYNSKQYRSKREYPSCAPIGAGMVLRKSALQGWIPTVGSNQISDRKGDELSSAGDCDIVLHTLEAGYSVAYWPQLTLLHIIPSFRITQKYLEKISRAAFRDFITVLDLHEIRVWEAIPKWTIPLRALKSWIKLRPWVSPNSSVQWHCAIGQFEGRARLNLK